MRQQTLFQNLVSEEQLIERFSEASEIDPTAGFNDQQAANFRRLQQRLNDPEAYREPEIEEPDSLGQDLLDLYEKLLDLPLGDIEQHIYDVHHDPSNIIDRWVDRAEDVIDAMEDLFRVSNLGEGQADNLLDDPPGGGQAGDTCFLDRGHCIPSYVELFVDSSSYYYAEFTDSTITRTYSDSGYFRVFFLGSTYYPYLYVPSRGDYPTPVEEIAYVPPPSSCEGGMYLWWEEQFEETTTRYAEGGILTVTNTSPSLLISYGGKTFIINTMYQVDFISVSSAGNLTLTFSHNVCNSYRVIFEPPCGPRYRGPYPEPPPPPYPPPMADCNCTKMMSMLKQILAILGSDMWFSSESDESASMKLNPDSWLKAFSQQIYTSQDSTGKEIQIQNVPNLIRAALAVGYKRSGFDRLPAKLPESLTDKEKDDQINIADMVSLQQWLIFQLDAVLGQYPIEIKYKNEAGEQKDLIFENQSEVQSEVLGMLINMVADVDNLVQMGMKSIVEAIRAGNSAIQAADYARANAEFLGYKSKERSSNMPLTITPGTTKLRDALKESNQKIIRFEFDDKDDLQDTLKRILLGTEIIKAAFSRPFDSENPIVPGDDIREDRGESNAREDEEWANFIASIETPMGQQRRDEGAPSPDLKDLNPREQ